jgi:hypothetical protein
MFDDFLDAAYLAGGRPEAKFRILASAALAIKNGDDWRDVLDCLIRNRPELFCEKEALKRQRKAQYGEAGGRFIASS